MMNLSLITEDAPKNLVPVHRMITTDTSSSDIALFDEGLRRLLDVQAELFRHKIPAGIIQAVVLTAVHGLSFDEENIEAFRKGNFPLTTDNAGDYLRYVDALETAVKTVVSDINSSTMPAVITAHDIFDGIIVHFSPWDEYELEELGIMPVMFLPEENQEED
ncbi:MAG: hypothetical protein U5L98_12850 [Halomonas sp.]|uniref:hypothetical protein n=1 Tax=Halomonas sp. TaxID=1486246 RepID=UPI002ACD91D9|nr:hypothetical protein [Halomonas sp.]MDZ7853495.1 hypothetical protein [Halomonas sp.]